MRRTACWCITATTAMGVLALGVAPAAEGAKGKTLRLTAVEIESTFLDLGTTGLSQGDQIVFADELRRRGRVVGEDGGTCTVTNLVSYDAFAANCVVTAELQRGQIAVQGLATFREGELLRATLAITGGTGAYRGASGEVRVREIREGRLRYTFRFDRKRR
jgi:hypothetical protein